MTTLSDRLYRRGVRAIERRRAEAEERRADLAAKLSHYDAVLEENRRLREAIAKAASIIERVVSKRIEPEGSVQ